MKTLKQILNKVEEEWVKGTQSTRGNEYREIFVNPTRSELEDIQEFGGVRQGDDVRFIADKYSENIYVASADVFHYTIVEEVDELNGTEDVVRNFSGMGSIENGIVTVSYFSDFFHEEVYYEQFGDLCFDVVYGDYDWMERYNFYLGEIIDVARDNLNWLKDEGYYSGGDY